MKNLDDFYNRLQKQVAQLGREPDIESLNALELNNYPYSVEVDKLVLSYFKTLPNHLGIRHMKINTVDPGITENYNDDFQDVNNTILRRLSTSDDKGLVLLHGRPGTGKTTYIRYLIGMVKKRKGSDHNHSRIFYLKLFFWVV